MKAEACASARLNPAGGTDVLSMQGAAMKAEACASARGAVLQFSWPVSLVAAMKAEACASARSRPVSTRSLTATDAAMKAEACASARLRSWCASHADELPPQ